MRTLLLGMLILLPSAHAMVIAQVLYDPAIESGGEAVEIRNDGSTARDLSGWVLATEASAADATIPTGTVLAAGGTYLIADTGWSTAKDNPAWKNADHEETLTMANANSGVALKDATGAVIDAVGWGDAAEIKEGLFEGTPALQVAAGKALVRSQDTDNNIADFDEAEPVFFAGESVMIIVNVTNATLNPLPLGAALDEDDRDEPGVQLKPVAGGTRALHLEVNYSGASVSASWFGKTVLLTKQTDQWQGELPLEYWYAPGSQTITISTPTQNSTILVTILEVKAAKLETKAVSLRASPGSTAKGTIKVQNQGNVPVEVAWSGADLLFGTQRIPFANLDVAQSTVKPAETKAINVELSVPVNALPGEYRTLLQMNED